jgi:hypothetical protein
MVIKNSNIPNLKAFIYLFGCALESSLQQIDLLGNEFSHLILLFLKSSETIY